MIVLILFLLIIFCIASNRAYESSFSKRAVSSLKYSENYYTSIKLRVYVNPTTIQRYFKFH